MPGQADVEHDEVGCLVGRDVEALLAGTSDRDLVALLLECVLDTARDGVLVFDDEDGGCHAADATPARWTATGRRLGAEAVVPCGPPFGRLATRLSRRDAARHPNTPKLEVTPLQRFPIMATARATLSANIERSPARRSRVSAVPASCRPSSTATASSPRTLDRQPRLRAAPAACRTERARRPVDRRQQAPAGPRPRCPVHPVNRRTLHVDLFLVRMTEEMTVDVPLVPTGESPAVEPAGWNAPPPDRVGLRPGAARPPAAGPRVFDRGTRRLRRDRPRSRSRDPVRRDAADRRRRDRRQGPGAARRGGRGGRRPRSSRASARGRCRSEGARSGHEGGSEG